MPETEVEFLGFLIFAMLTLFAFCGYIVKMVRDYVILDIVARGNKTDIEEIKEIQSQHEQRLHEIDGKLSDKK